MESGRYTNVPGPRKLWLHVKKKKCSFAQEEVMFLGFIIGRGKIRMDQAKIQAILEWEPPTKVKELRSFLGLVNYY